MKVATRKDIKAALKAAGVKPLPVPAVLRAMADTFETRNKVYGDNFRLVGLVLAAFFPEGVHLRTAEDYEVWHLFELQIVKLTRFTVSKLTHIDSIHDVSVYGAMLEAILNERKTHEQNSGHRRRNRTGRGNRRRTQK